MAPRPSTRRAVELAAPTIALPPETTDAELAMALALATRHGLRTIERAFKTDPEWMTNVRRMTVKSAAISIRVLEQPDQATCRHQPEVPPTEAHTYLPSLPAPLRSLPPTAADVPPIDPKALATQVLGKNQSNMYPASCVCGEHIPVGYGYFAVPFPPEDGASVYCLLCLWRMAALEVGQ